MAVSNILVHKSGGGGGYFFHKTIFFLLALCSRLFFGYQDNISLKLTIIS